MFIGKEHAVLFTRNTMFELETKPPFIVDSESDRSPKHRRPEYILPSCCNVIGITLQESCHQCQYVFIGRISLATQQFHVTVCRRNMRNP